MRQSRRFLKPNTLCYLCGKEIDPSDSWNRDHIPPARFFGKSFKRAANLQLQWLPTHIDCNSQYRKDEELFTLNAVFMASASGSVAADSLLDDIRRGILKGHATGLFLSIGPQFNSLPEQDGSISFTYDGSRTLRIIWKIVRGLYMLEMNRHLAESTPHHCYPLIAPLKATEQLAQIEWIFDLRGAPMGTHPLVLDYKWMCFIDPENPALRAHGVVLLLWDRVMAPVLIHDPTCRCRQCQSQPD